MHILMNYSEIKYKAAHFIGPFFMFNAQQKASVYKLLPVLKGATYVSGGAGLPAKV